MIKRAYFVHGWSGRSDSAWRPWLKKELEAREFRVESLAMPDADTPRIEIWVPYLLSVIKNPDENTVLVGHSMGCQAIMRFLEKLPEGVCVGKVVFVGGFTESISNLETDEERSIAKPWLETPIDFLKVKLRAKEIVAFFSDNDRWVPLENEKAMKEKLGAKTIIEHGMHHYGDRDGITEVPSILSEIAKS